MQKSRIKSESSQSVTPLSYRRLNSHEHLQASDAARSRMGSGASAQRPIDQAKAFKRSPIKDWDKPALTDDRAASLFRLVQLKSPTVQQVASLSPDVNQPWVYCRRLLHYAAEKNNAKLTRWLIENGANATAQDADGWGAGHFAASTDASQALATLAKLSPDCLSLRNVEGDTPLATAAANGHRRAVDELLKAKVDCNCVNCYGDTPVTLAAAAGHSSVVKLLAEKSKADLRHRNNDGRSALAIARDRKDNELVKLLSGKGVKN